MNSTVYKIISLSSLVVLLLGSMPALCLQTYFFSVEKPQLIIFPQTDVIKKKEPTRLSVISNEFSNASQLQKYQFIQIALTELISVHEEEAQRAREQASIVQKKEQRNKLYRWSNNVLGYAQQLIEIFNNMNDTAALEVYTDDNYDSYISVNDYPIVISSPVINQQASLEHRIVDSICENSFCDEEYLSSIVTEETKAIRIEAGWKVTKDKYIFYTQSGLHFVFKDIKHKKLKQKMGLKIAADLTLMAESLKEFINQGIFVDWEQLVLKEKSGSHLYELVLNGFGDKVILQLKAIYRLEGLVQKSIPWLKERLVKKRKEFYLHNGDEFLRQIYAQ